jgi:hypothetical protein
MWAYDAVVNRDSLRRAREGHLPEFQRWAGFPMRLPEAFDAALLETVGPLAWLVLIEVPFAELLTCTYWVNGWEDL